jgi:hypothetical protein
VFGRGMRRCEETISVWTGHATNYLLVVLVRAIVEPGAAIWNFPLYSFSSKHWYGVHRYQSEPVILLPARFFGCNLYANSIHSMIN